MDLIAAHFNHKARGADSEEDQRFVERLCGDIGVPLEVGSARRATVGKGRRDADDPLKQAGFEEKARGERRDFLKKAMADLGIGKILIAHTADDQVETVLMRIMEGAGVSGVKGIPRKTSDGIERPLLDTWRDEILADLRKRKIPYRVDKSNFDTRFERNWVRHVLIPLLEKRYGKSVKKRIFALGERFREIDDFLETAARRWIKRNVKAYRIGGPGEARGKPLVGRDTSIGRQELHFQRKLFVILPSALRKKALQIVCFERIGVAPNERLLDAMDRLIVSGGPSARLNVGKGVILKCRYERAIFEIGGKKSRTTGFTRLEMRGPGTYRIGEDGQDGIHRWTGGPMEIRWEEKRGIKQSSLKVLSENQETAAFDLSEILLPLSVRPLRAGDRIMPFGLAAEKKKVKEILIDRKVPADDRWGRPALCDAEGEILWIPGVVRSAHAKVTSKTRQTVVLRLELRYLKGNNQK